MSQSLACHFTNQMDNCINSRKTCQIIIRISFTLVSTKDQSNHNPIWVMYADGCIDEYGEREYFVDI